MGMRRSIGKREKGSDLTVLACSKASAESFESNAPWSMISIGTDPNDLPEFQESEKFVGISRYIFHDLSDPEWFGHRYAGRHYFQRSQAIEILSFVAEVRELSSILIVHCDAGISRSAGVAAALGLILNGRGGDRRFFSPPYVPNMHVYRLLLDTYSEIVGEDTARRTFISDGPGPRFRVRR